jgi:molybdopterin converting factor small subunit
MTITALLFAAYAEALGSHEVRLQLETGATVADALAGLRSLPGGEKLPHRPLVAVNLAYASLDRPLLPSDELALIPPVAGG